MADVGGESVTRFTLAKLQEANLEDAGSLDKQPGSWSEKKECRLGEQRSEVGRVVGKGEVWVGERGDGW